MIIFVDDDKRYMKAYVEELHSLGYDVLQEYDVDKALALVVEKHKEIDLLVLDMNIPPGTRLMREESDNVGGKRTGYLFLQEIQSIIKGISFPLIIFTHVNTEKLASKMNDFPKIKIHLMQKEEYTPYELAEEIKEILTEVNKKNKV